MIDYEKEYQKEYYARNRERLCRYHKRYYRKTKNDERLMKLRKESAKRYRESHREQIREKARNKYRETHPQKQKLFLVYDKDGVLNYFGDYNGAKEKYGYTDTYLKWIQRPSVQKRQVSKRIVVIEEELENE